MTILGFNFLGVFGATILFVVAYLFLLRRLADMAQPIRLEMAEIGERLLAANISESRKSQVIFYLDNAFSGCVAPLAVVLFPIAATAVLFKKSAGRLNNAPATLDDRKLALFFSVSIFVSNPIVATFLVLELFGLGFVLFASKGPSAVIAALLRTVRAEQSIPWRRERSAVY